MKPCILMALAMIFGFDAVAADASEITKLDSYVVSERPFGFIGLKVVTAHLGFFGIIGRRGHIKSLDVDELYPDSPAVQAGIVPKDKLIRIDGTPITTFTIEMLVKKYSRAEVGQRIVFEVLHKGEDKPETIEIVVAKKKKPNSESSTNPQSRRRARFIKTSAKNEHEA